MIVPMSTAAMPKLLVSGDHSWVVMKSTTPTDLIAFVALTPEEQADQHHDRQHQRAGGPAGQPEDLVDGGVDQA